MFAPLFRTFAGFSIKRKLTLIITLTSALSLLLACAGFVLNDVLTFREVTRDNTATLATVVGNNTVAALNFADPPAAAEALATFSGEPHVIGAVLYKAGQRFAEYRRPGATDPLPAEPPPAGLVRFAGGRLELSRSVIADGEVLGTLYVVTDLGALDQRLRNYVTIAGALLFAATLAAYGLSGAFQRVVSRPLSKLVGVARRVTDERDYSIRAPAHRRDEIGQLFAGFNEMLTQIQQRDAALLAAHDDLERRVQERTRELSQQIAERRAAERALQQQLTRISLLNQIATALSDRQNLDRIMQIVLAELEEHLPVDFGSVSIFDSAAQKLEIAASRRRPSATALDVAPASLAPGGAFAAALDGLDDCRQGNQVYIPDTSAVAHPVAQRFAGAGLGSVVAVPLLVERRFFGLLVVARAERDAFTSGESEFLRMLGEQVGVAGSQARLYSELQRAYTDLRESQRTVMQQERLRALGQMASGIAHDINNSLTPIVAFADILLMERNELPEKVQTYLTHIQTAGVDIGTIVSRLREFYRPRDSDEPHLPVDLHAVLRQVAELTRPRWRDMPQARGTVIELKRDFAGELELVSGNESELRESLINLVLNAVDAMPEGGTLTLRTRVEPPPGAAGKEVVVEVVDTGIGMDEETRHRCLEPFFSTKGQHGTGLGLAMVYGVIERHSGRIEIESARGVGTTMRLRFPAREAEAHSAAAILDAHFRSLHILCVDDDPMLRNVLGEMFRVDDHVFAVAESGAEGLVLFQQAMAAGRGFDIVISDLGMPHMDGQQFAQAIKRLSPETPVVLLTGWGKIMKDDGALPVAVDAILSKPPRLKDLRTTLTRLLRRRVRGRASVRPESAA